MRDSSTFTARGFGPGLPPAGVPIDARWSGDTLYLEAWPESVRAIRGRGADTLRLSLPPD